MTPHDHPFRSLLALVPLALGAAGLAGPASAQLGSVPLDQDVRARLTETDASRDEVDLRADVREAVQRETDVANTALVFNNVDSVPTRVTCTAFDGEGNRLARRSARVPAQGLRYLRASDLSEGADFVGSAVCVSRGRVAASAVFLAPGSITKLDVIQSDAWHESARIRFPLIATY